MLERSNATVSAATTQDAPSDTEDDRYLNRKLNFNLYLNSRPETGQFGPTPPPPSSLPLPRLLSSRRYHAG